MPDVTGTALATVCLVGSVVATYLWSTDTARQARALNVLRMFLRPKHDVTEPGALNRSLVATEDSAPGTLEGDGER
jgi:hypothetical protein